MGRGCAELGFASEGGPSEALPVDCERSCARFVGTVAGKLLSELAGDVEPTTERHLGDAVADFGLRR